MKKPLVAILGCGPSGLLAAHACAMRDVPFVVFSKPIKSMLGGAQYSHIPIPGIHYEDEPEALLTYQVVGDTSTYQNKVYGDNPVPFVSMEKVEDGKQVPAWNLRKMYDQLWDLYHFRIVDYDIGPHFATGLNGTFDLSFSSIPAPAICQATLMPDINHWFKQQTIRIYNDNISELPDNTILYDGIKEHSFYRQSKIFGVGSTEWSANSPVPPLPGLRTVSKPLETNCDCYKETIIKIGRFGAWKKGVLTFHAYHEVIDQLAKRGIE